jgi:23S rRNA (adenine2503-C2)-methyltransferase
LSSLLGIPIDDLHERLRSEGLEPYRARQLARWIYARGVREFDRMTDLPAPLRAELASRFSTRALELAASQESRDGAVKLALRTAEGARIETVLIPEGRRRTVCVSAQIGCSLDCTFCATGRMGLLRNLRTEEIVDQVLLARDLLAARGEHPTHVVFMGMGEPLLNLRAVVSAIRILTHEDGLAIAPRRITVSTAGVVSRMADLGREVPVGLAVSLHATTDDVRDRLVPLNRRFPLAALLDACRSYPLGPRARLSFEYALIRDVNDSAADAARLVRLVSGIRALVNLIPLNEHPGAPFRAPSEAAVDGFARVLARARVPVSVRRSRGADILAACGQLGAAALDLTSVLGGR